MGSNDSFTILIRDPGIPRYLIRQRREKSETVTISEACSFARLCFAFHNRRALRSGKTKCGKSSGNVSWMVTSIGTRPKTGKYEYTEGKKKTSSSCRETVRDIAHRSRSVRRPWAEAASTGGVLVGTRTISTVLGSSKVVWGEFVKNTKALLVSTPTSEPSSYALKRPHP